MVYTLTPEEGVAIILSIVLISKVAKFSILLLFILIAPVLGLIAAISFSGLVS